LLRYENENGTVLSANNFIPAAERYNLIAEVDLYVIRKTLEYMKESKTKEIFAINLSGTTLGNKMIDREVIKLIDHYGINPEQLCFEITETTAITNKSNAVKFMNILHGIGCNFSLDDFGSGLSSFGYLRTLPIDTVKIDGYFVKNMEIDPANELVIKSINDISHSFGLKTIAECVETQDQMDLLANIGIDYFQGYLIQRPERLEFYDHQEKLVSVEKAVI
jgi:EAL domain-containing protein (putative c-di-GMP-specific phosphodiesterase class I)